MKIGSINKTSLLDYPGKLSVIIGTQGCNMHCPWCHNSYLIPYEFTKHTGIIKQEDFFNFLEQRQNFLEAVVITGGEPTLQTDITQFCKNVKEMGFAVKIDTNGTNPKVLKRLLENDLVDYIAMDVKTDLNRYPKLFRENIDKKKILESIDIIMSVDKPYEFRTTCVTPFVSLENIDLIGELVKSAQNLFLQKCSSLKRIGTYRKFEIINENHLKELKQRAQSYVQNCAIR